MNGMGRCAAVACGLVFCVSSMGCETLKKKFTRKRRRPEAQEVMIVSPRDYSSHPFPAEVLYKQYFVYWKSWQQELVSNIGDRASHKKIVDCAEQALVNLRKMSAYLDDAKAAELATYILEMEALKAEIVEAKNFPDARLNSLRYKAERILSNVSRKFDRTKMKDFIRT